MVLYLDKDNLKNEKINKAMELARYELKSAQILLDAEQYRDSITHSYYAMFTAAKAMLFTEDYESKSHDNTLSEFGRIFLHESNKFNRDSYEAYYNSKKQRKKTSYDFTIDFTEEDAEKRVIQAEKFISDAEEFFKKYWNKNQL